MLKISSRLEAFVKARTGKVPDSLEVSLYEGLQPVSPDDHPIGALLASKMINGFTTMLSEMGEWAGLRLKNEVVTFIEDGIVGWLRIEFFINGDSIGSLDGVAGYGFNCEMGMPRLKYKKGEEIKLVLWIDGNDRSDKKQTQYSPSKQAA